MKKTGTLLFIAVLILSCSNDAALSNQIIGNWKLTEARLNGFEGVGSIDYSKEDIIYTFKSNGKLIVSGGTNVGYENGEYAYFFGEDHLGGTSDPKILLVKINNAKWTYNLTDGKMTLGQSYVDGTDLIFEKK